MVFVKTMNLHPRIQAYINNLPTEGSQRTGSSILYTFQKFCQDKYKSLDNALEMVLKKKVNKYRFVIEFKNHTLNKEISQGVKKGRVNTVVNFVEWDLRDKDEDFFIDRNVIRRDCHWGSTEENEKTPLDRATVVKILQTCDTPRLKAFLHLLAAIGCRPKKEACNLKLKDIVFDAPQPYIHFPKEITKTKKERNTFMTKELVEVLKKWINHNYRERKRFVYKDSKYVKTIMFTPPKDPNNLLFAVNEQSKMDASKRSKSIYFYVSLEFHRLLTDLNLEKRNDINRREITLKSFRDFVYSTINTLGDTQLAEYHIGHKKSTYWNLTQENKIKAFRNIEVAITYLNADSIAAATQDLYSQNQRLTGEVIEMKKKLANLENTLLKDYIEHTEREISKMPDDEDMIDDLPPLTTSISKPRIKPQIKSSKVKRSQVKASNR